MVEGHFYKDYIDGWCPEQNCDYSVLITFKEIAMLGASHPARKPTGMSCEYVQEHSCHVGGPDGSQCPLWLKALRSI